MGVNDAARVERTVNLVQGGASKETSTASVAVALRIRETRLPDPEVLGSLRILGDLGQHLGEPRCLRAFDLRRPRAPDPSECVQPFLPQLDRSAWTGTRHGRELLLERGERRARCDDEE